MNREFTPDFLEVIPPEIAQSLAAFRRDLPELRKEHYFEWVAYSGDERIGFGQTKTELYQQCFRRGLKREEFLVASIEPEIEREIDLIPEV